MTDTAASQPEPSPASNARLPVQDYTLVLEIVAIQPITHGEGNEGNRQILRRTTELVRDPRDPSRLRPTEIPIISGAAMRATLREAATDRYLRAVGTALGSVTLDRLRLLLKGGKNDGGGATVSIEEQRHLYRICPVIALFGGMDGGNALHGKLKVGAVRPWSRAVHATPGFDRTLRPVGEEDGEAIEIFPDLAPVDDDVVVGFEEFYRHDMRSSLTPAKWLSSDAVQAITDAQAKRGTGPADTLARRTANESMPYAMETIRAGTPLFTVLRVHDATEPEMALLALALRDWIAHGGHLGGGSGAGRGSCAVKVKGLRHDPYGLSEGGSVPGGGAVMPHGTTQAEYASRVLLDALAPHIAEIHSWLSETKADKAAAKADARNAKADKKKGKAKLSALPDDDAGAEP